MAADDVRYDWKRFYYPVGQELTLWNGFLPDPDDEYGLYFKTARVFMKLMGQPALMRELTRVGMHSRTLMDWVLRIMANLLRDDELGPAEAVYLAVAQLARVIPEPSAA